MNDRDDPVSEVLTWKISRTGMKFLIYKHIHSISRAVSLTVPAYGSVVKEDLKYVCSSAVLAHSHVKFPRLYRSISFLHIHNLQYYILYKRRISRTRKVRLDVAPPRETSQDVFRKCLKYENETRKGR